MDLDERRNQIHEMQTMLFGDETRFKECMMSLVSMFPVALPEIMSLAIVSELVKSNVAILRQDLLETKANANLLRSEKATLNGQIQALRGEAERLEGIGGQLTQDVANLEGERALQTMSTLVAGSRVNLSDMAETAACEMVKTLQQEMSAHVDSIENTYRRKFQKVTRLQTNTHAISDRLGRQPSVEIEQPRRRRVPGGNVEPSLEIEDGEEEVPSSIFPPIPGTIPTPVNVKVQDINVLRFMIAEDVLLSPETILRVTKLISYAAKRCRFILKPREDLEHIPKLGLCVCCIAQRRAITVCQKASPDLGCKQAVTFDILQINGTGISIAAKVADESNESEDAEWLRDQISNMMHSVNAVYGEHGRFRG